MPSALAETGGYIDDAAEALAQGNVYVSREVDGSTALADSLQAQIGDASVGVAVFSDNAALEASGPDIVRALASTDGIGYDTIIVAVGDDLSAGSRVLPSGEAMRIANEAEASAADVDDALTQTVQTILVDSEPDPVAVGDAGGGGIAIAIAIGAVVLIGGATGLFFGLRRRRSVPVLDPPTRVAIDLQTLRTVRPSYAALGAAGNQIAAETATDIDALVDNVGQLFSRLGKKGAEDQRGLAEIEYSDKLAKLTTALERDYLLDILTHPHLWDDPAERVREVRQAVVAVSDELVENIKQVNARRALQFQVSLDSLIGRRKELQDWERDFRDAVDGDPPAR